MLPASSLSSLRSICHRRFVGFTKSRPAVCSVHGIRAFLSWLQGGEEVVLAQAVFVPHLNALALALGIPLDAWPFSEKQSLPMIDFAVGYITRLLACHKEANDLDDLERAGACALRVRFQADTQACLALAQSSGSPVPQLHTLQ